MYDFIQSDVMLHLQVHYKHIYVSDIFLCFQSKGGILSKACDYINELRTANVRLQETMKDTDRLTVDIELLRQQCEELKNENVLLRTHMQQHGIVLPDISGGT